MMTNKIPPRALSSGLAARLQRQRIFYGWVIVFVCFLVLCLAFGVRLSFSIFFAALAHSDTFGWSRGETAGVFSLSMLVFALAGAPVGWLLDRLGARRVFVIGILVRAGHYHSGPGDPCGDDQPLVCAAGPTRAGNWSGLRRYRDRDTAAGPAYGAHYHPGKLAHGLPLPGGAAAAGAAPDPAAAPG